jgi:hypothetical protein
MIIEHKISQIKKHSERVLIDKDEKKSEHLAVSLFNRSTHYRHRIVQHDKQYKKVMNKK